MTVPLPMPQQIEVLQDSPSTFRSGLLGNVVTCSWRGPLSNLAVTQIAQLTRGLMQRFGPLRHSYLHLMTERVQLPDAAARTEIAQLLPELSEHVGVVAVVLDGGGFWSSALRSFLTGLRVVAPRTFDIRAESSIDHVLQWFPAEHQKRTGVAVTREQIEWLLHEAKSWQKP